MVDVVSPEKRSQMMSGIKSKDTKPEIAIRRTLHRLGFRFRLHRKGLPGKPDNPTSLQCDHFCAWLFLAWPRKLPLV